MSVTRRDFLVRSGGGLAGAALFANGDALRANPLNLPFGFQAFEIIPDLNKDWDGTLRKMAGFGFAYIDLVTGAPYLSATRTAKDLRASLESHGLGCSNAHFGYNAFKTAFADTIGKAHDLKVSSVICSPWNRRQTSEDWKLLGAELNAFGAQTQKEGVLLGYHNHEVEFRPTTDGGIPYDILMANTDPALVKFQIDVGNLAFGGADPYAYLSKYPTRYFSVHVKDLQPGKAAVPVGSGSLDWKRIFTLVKAANVQNIVAEVGAYGASTLNGGALEPASYDTLELYRLSAIHLRNFKEV